MKKVIRNPEMGDKAWNVVTGCDKYSDGCLNCYAEDIVDWLKGMGQKVYEDNGFNLTLHHDRLDWPLRKLPKKPKSPARSFVTDMGDLFHEKVTDGFIYQVFDTMFQVPQHRFFVLTKRSERLTEFSNTVAWRPWIWAGVTVESNKYLHRIDHLKKLPPEANKFLMLEPLLSAMPKLDLDGIHWVVVGGETNKKMKFRPMKEEWVIGIRDQVKKAGIPFMFKHWPGKTHNATEALLEGRRWEEYPESVLHNKDSERSIKIQCSKDGGRKIPLDNVITRKDSRSKNGHPPFNPKYIFVQKKAKEYPLYAEVRERYPHATYEEFEGDHRNVPQLRDIPSERYLKAKTDTLILASRGVKGAISENANKANSDFIFAGIGYGCLFGCVYCYTNLNKLWHLNVAPFTLYANIDETLKYLVDHQRQQGRQVWYDLSCNNDSIAEGAFFSSTAKMIETIAKTENAYGMCTTKATNIDYLSNLNHNGKITIKLTLAPPFQIKDFEYFTGTLAERIDALNRLKEAGYSVGINFSPIVLRASWLEDYIDLFRYIDANLTDAAKENLIGEAFFFTYRKVLAEKLPVFRKQFAVLHNPDEYPTKPKRMGVHHYRDLKKPIEDFKASLEKYLPYLQLRYIF